MRNEQPVNHAGNDEETIEIDVSRLLKAIWKKAWLIIVVTLLCGSAAYLGTKLFVTPTYRATFTAYVNNKNTTESSTSVSNSDLSAAQSLVYTYANILTSRSVLTAAAEQVGQDYEYSNMKNWVSVDVVDDTEIIEVNVTMDDPEEALALATAIEGILPGYVTEIVEGSSVVIIDGPVLPEDIYSPNFMRNTLIGAMLGLFAVAIIIVLQELLNDTVRDENELERRFNVAIIGSIPDLASKLDSKYGYGYGQKHNESVGRRTR